MLGLKIDLIFEYVKCNNKNYLSLGSTKVFHRFQLYCKSPFPL